MDERSVDKEMNKKDQEWNLNFKREQHKLIRKDCWFIFKILLVVAIVTNIIILAFNVVSWVLNPKYAKNRENEHNVKYILVGDESIENLNNKIEILENTIDSLKHDISNIKNENIEVEDGQ